MKNSDRIRSISFDYFTSFFISFVWFVGWRKLGKSDLLQGDSDDGNWDV